MPSSTPACDVQYSMSLPETYKDIHAGMAKDLPRITKQRVLEYLAQFDKQLEDVSKDMYKERFLQFVRAGTGADPDVTFFYSLVWAEFSKSVEYRVDVSVNSYGVVQEAQCECGAGQGPTGHCKHVACVLYGITCFLESGNLLTELTCTQVLQTFHRAKAFKGSPLKAQDLQSIREKDKKDLIYDPRPESCRNCKENVDRFRNLCLNQMHKEKQPMPVLQLFEPANPHGLAHDHDYMELTPEDQFLKNLLVSEISANQANFMEEATRGQANNNLWRNTRLHHLTASNFGTICKCTERRNIVSLCQSLTSDITLNTRPILHGKQYESIAVEKYEELTGIKTKPCGIYISLRHPQLAASPDRIIDEDTILEVKCPWSAKEKKISHLTVPYLKENCGNLLLDEKHDYYYQIQGQLFCSDRKHCILVVYTLKDFVVVNVPRNDKFIDEMVQKLLVFYDSHFKEAVVEKFYYKNYYQYRF